MSILGTDKSKLLESSGSLLFCHVFINSVEFCNVIPCSSVDTHDSHPTMVTTSSSETWYLCATPHNVTVSIKFLKHERSVLVRTKIQMVFTGTADITDGQTCGGYRILNFDISKENWAFHTSMIPTYNL